MRDRPPPRSGVCFFRGASRRRSDWDDTNYSPNRTVADRPDEESSTFIAQELSNLRRIISDFAYLTEARTHLVDEYQPQTLSSQVSSLSWQPEYQSEIIEAIIVQGPTYSANAGASVGSAGKVTSPGVLALITQTGAALPPGQYAVSGTIFADGTVAAIDDDNMELLVGNNVISTLSYSAQANGIPVPYGPYILNLPGGGTNVKIFAINAGTLNSVYHASIIITPLPNSPFTLQLGKRVWSLSLPPSGILVIPNVHFRLDEGDARILTASNAGDWSVELMGYQNPRLRYRE